MLRAILIMASAFTAEAGEIRGAALDGKTLITWGDEVRRWRFPSLASVALPVPGLERGEGGCVVGSGTPKWGLLLAEAGALVLRRAPRFDAEIVDRQGGMHDCLASEIDGRSGILVLNDFAQIRFYERRDGAWAYREIYTIYTPSRQGGLSIAPFGLVAGNYWFRRPESGGLAWREYAINAWTETEDSASLRFAWLGADLVAAQGHMAEARLARFSPPADITQLWNEERLAEELRLRYPHAVASDGESLLVVGENAGRGSRLFVFRGRARPELIATTGGTHSAFIVEGGALTVGANAVEWRPLNPADKRRPRASNPRAPGRKRR